MSGTFVDLLQMNTSNQVAVGQEGSISAILGSPIFPGNTTADTAGLDVGVSTTTQSWIDFHSSRNSNDYDARIYATGGTTLGTGYLQFICNGIRFPNMTTVQKAAITPSAGTVVFDTTLAKLGVYQSSAWKTLADKEELALSTGTSLVGHISTGTGAVARTTQAKLRDTINAKDFGATGDGITNDTTTIQAALDYLNSIGGGTLKFTGNVTYLACNLQVYSNTHIIIDDETTVKQYVNTSSIFKMVGSIGSPILLTADANSGDIQLTVSSTTGLVAGDWIILKDNINYSTSSDAVGYKSGESCLIASVDGLTTLTLKHPIYGSMQTSKSFSVANTSSINKVSKLENISITGGNVVLLKTSNTNGVESYYCKDLNVKGVKFSNIGGAGILHFACLDSKIEDCTFSDGIDRVDLGMPGYGIMALWACWNLTVSTNLFRRVRHGFTTGGGAYGFPHNVNILNNIATDCTHVGLDTHEAGLDITFRGNTVIDCAGGINSRSGHTVIDSNTITRSSEAGIGWVGTNISNVTISNNYVRGAASYGISSPSSCPNLTITNNTLSDVGLNAIAVFGGLFDDKLSPNLFISKNTIINYSTASVNGVGILVGGTYQNVVTITDNILDKGTGTASKAIQCIPNVSGIIEGNIIKGSHSGGNVVFATGSAMGNFKNQTDTTLKTRIITLAQDTAIYIPVATVLNSLVKIGSASAGNGYPNGTFRIRTNSSPQCAVVGMLSVTNIVFTTATVLTGTTGISGNTTISAVDGGIYIENRIVGITNVMWIEIDGPCY